jgi:hypothetical protein
VSHKYPYFLGTLEQKSLDISSGNISDGTETEDYHKKSGRSKFKLWLKCERFYWNQIKHHTEWYSNSQYGTYSTSNLRINEIYIWAKHNISCVNQIPRRKVRTRLHSTAFSYKILHVPWGLQLVVCKSSVWWHTTVIVHAPMSLESTIHFLR